MLAVLSKLMVRIDPSLILDELGFDPDPWQRDFLRSRAPRILLNIHRQGGKSTATAALALWTALHEAPALILVVSASQRQSGEIYKKIADGYRALGRPVPAVEDNSTTLALANGSRIVSLPDSPDTVVGYSGPRLIVVDEAARVSDPMLVALAPMTIMSGGRMVMMSTPKGKRGIFHAAWTAADADWNRVEFKASDNPRADPAGLAEQRAIMGERAYRQEFECSFEENVDAVFSAESIDAAFDTDLEPLFAGGLSW